MSLNFTGFVGRDYRNAELAVHPNRRFGRASTTRPLATTATRRFQMPDQPYCLQRGCVRLRIAGIHQSSNHFPGVGTFDGRQNRRPSALLCPLI